MTNKERVLMSCGHVAEAIDKQGNPACPACFDMPGIRPMPPPDMADRMDRGRSMLIMTVAGDGTND